MADLYGTMKANNSGIGYFTINGVKNTASYTKSNITKLYIVSFIPVEQYMSKINSVRNGIIIVIIISLIISSLLILLFSRSITKPLKLAVEYIRTFALGDFSKKVPDKAMRVSDETGDLMVSLNTMQKSIRTMIKTVVRQSEKIESSVIITNKNMYDLEYQIEEISSTTEELSASMEETAASSEELSASSDELGKLAEDSKNITNEIQRVTKIVVPSVESLKYNSENVLDFIDSTVIKDYISMVDIGEQYYKDANNEINSLQFIVILDILMTHIIVIVNT